MQAKEQRVSHAKERVFQAQRRTKQDQKQEKDLPQVLE